MKALNILLTALLFSFILLKVLGIVDWSWWIVLSPFLAPAAFVWLVVTIGVFIQWKQHEEEI